MKKRRVIAAVLSVLMIFGVFQISASAAGKTEFGMIDQYVSDGFDVLQNKGVFETLYQGCIDHESSVNLYQYNIPNSEIGAVFDAFLSIYPEIFFVDRQYQYSSIYNYQTHTYVIYEFYLYYTVDSKAKSDEMLEEFYAKADEYLALVKDANMDEFAKALVLHDALVLNNEYDIDRYVNNVYVYSSNYTFMVDGWGRCENYAECYAYLLSKVGIKSEIINSEDMVHEWMKIQLGGENYYYNVDVTWDDPVYDGIGDLPDKVSHQFFLLSDDYIQSTENFPEQDSEGNYINVHHDYEDINDADDDYDDHIILHSLDNPMFYIGGKIYTIGYVENEGYCIATYDFSSDSLSKDLKINDSWYGYWGYNFSGIGMDKGVLYYNGENCVYCYDPTTGVNVCWLEDIFSDGSQIYGLYVKDGEIWGGIATSPNETAEFQYLNDCIPFYDVTVDESIENGTVEASKEATFAGNTVTLTVTPDDGYELEGVSVNGEPLEAVGGEYTFEMPGEEATVTASFKKAVVAGHSLSLDGDIGVNFYYNLTDEEAAGQSVDFTWTVNNVEKQFSDTLDKDSDTGLYKATCPIAVAEMTYDVTATLSIGEETIVDTYSAVTYADVILTDSSFAQKYIAAENITGNNGTERLASLRLLVKTMLYYGARAQVQFDRDKDHLADTGIDYTPETVTAEGIGDTGASDMYEDLEAYGLEYKGSTVVYLSKTSLRHYYKIVDQDKFDLVKDSITFNGVSVGYTKKEGKIYFQLENIEAANLDTPYFFTIGNSAYQYSVIQYVKECLVQPSSVSVNMQALAAATYLYNSAANQYFGS